MSVVDNMQGYTIRELQEQEQLYANTCEECGTIFNTKLKLAKHCGTCTTVANVLYVWYMVLSQKYRVTVQKPNLIIERVFNAQVKPFRRLTQGG